jgi:hypothetical protein
LLVKRRKNILSSEVRVKMISSFFDWIDRNIDAAVLAAGYMLVNTAVFIATAAVMIGIIASPGAFFLRGAYYIYYGEWIHSACDTAYRTGLLKDGNCLSNTGFLGLDKIVNYASSSVDLSVGLLLLAGVLLLCLLGTLFAAFIISAAVRG